MKTLNSIHTRMVFSHYRGQRGQHVREVMMTRDDKEMMRMIGQMILGVEDVVMAAEVSVSGASSRQYSGCPRSAC